MSRPQPMGISDMNAPTLAGLAIAFVVLLVVFRALEWLPRRSPRSKILRAGFRTDVLYWFFTPLFNHYVVRTVTIAAVVVFAIAVYGTVDEGQIQTGFGPLSRLPYWQQALLMLVVGDFIAYWTHRAFHGRRLWNIHAIHHSPRSLDWLAALRVHPISDIAGRLAVTLPLLALGFAPLAAAAITPVFGIFAIMLHANLDWDWGPFRSVVASPRFHRWHHTSEAEGRDKNFAGLLPVWDILFGTYYMPRDKLPQHFGTDTPVPETFLGQMAFPFRRSRSANAP
jgi:sterol desaturase/sphingolipid hydroxylase (fatty acid hydroxylase superfamily)